jgi:hypothetical protein
MLQAWEQRGEKISGGVGLKSRFGDRVFRLKYFAVFANSFSALYWATTSSFYNLQFIIHSYPIVWQHRTTSNRNISSFGFG